MSAGKVAMHCPHGRVQEAHLGPGQVLTVTFPVTVPDCQSCIKGASL